MPRITVQIEGMKGAPLPPNACARVTVEDVSQLDAPSVVIGETVLEDLDTSGPLHAEVEVDDVNPSADVIVRVHVAERSRAGRQVEVGDLLTTMSHPVLTHGHGHSVVVHPKLVG